MVVMAEDPASIVTSFIKSMHGWELEAAAAKRLARAAGEESNTGYAIETLQAVFRQHCTTRASERPQGRLAAPFFQKPPEYDPANERIVTTSSENPHTTTVETERTAVLGEGRYRYQLHKVDGGWLIDSVKYLQEEKWISHTL